MTQPPEEFPQPYGESYPAQGQPYGQPAQPPYAPPYPSGYGQPAYGWPSQNLAGPPPTNYLVWAILTTALCCLPLGIVSIVKSSQVNALWAQGQYNEARKSSDEAKKWAIWSAVVAVVVNGLLIIAYVVFIAAMMANSSSY